MVVWVQLRLLLVLKRKKFLQTTPFNEFRGFSRKVVQVVLRNFLIACCAERNNVSGVRVAFIKNFNTAENLIKHQVFPMNKNIARADPGITMTTAETGASFRLERVTEHRTPPR